MEEYAWEFLDKDLELGCEIMRYFKILFALTYLDACVQIEFITEKEKEDIMDYLAMRL